MAHQDATFLIDFLHWCVSGLFVQNPAVNQEPPISPVLGSEVLLLEVSPTRGYNIECLFWHRTVTRIYVTAHVLES
jgi:hypothetical protein